MRYIKVQYKLSRPGALPYSVYGFDTQWVHKTQITNGMAVEKGDIVDFAPVKVQPDGKCLILGTNRNIKNLRGLLAAGQAILGPGETLESLPEAPTAKAEEIWPTAPVVEEDALVAAVTRTPPVGKAKRVGKTVEDMTPDVG